MENGLSALQISSKTSTNSINDKNDKALAKILKHYVMPKSETSEISNSSSKSSQNNSKGNVSNHSNFSQISDKENLDIPELSFYKNSIIKNEIFYDRIIRKFREQQAIVNLASSSVVKQKTPEDIFKEKLEILKKGLETIEPPKKKEIFPNYSKKIAEFLKLEMSGPLEAYIIDGKNIRIRDLKTIYKPSSWLNDEVINHYFSLIVDRDPLSIHIFETFFYTKLS